MNSRTLLAPVSLALLVALPQSCRSPVGKGEVQREWNDTLRELGINPVFPPREDVQVGDVYVRRGNPAAADLFPAKGYVPIDLWFAALDIRADLKAFYSRRSEHASTIPRLPDGDGAGAVSPIADVPSVATGDSFTNSSVVRLRQVAFPDFMGMSISGADLRGLVPVEAIQLAIGASWNSEHQVLVKIPSAESCGLPLRSALSQIVVEEVDGSGFTLSSTIATPAELQLLRAGQRSWIETTPQLGEKARAELLADPLVYLDVITEVFYARAIDISILTRQSMGGTAQVKPPAATAKALGPDGEADVEDGKGVLSDEDLHALGAVSLAERMNEELDEIGAQSIPGGSFRFLSAAAGSVSMRRTYAHPIAIGYRSLLLAVDPDTGRIANMGSKSVAVAETTAGSPDEVATRIGDAIETWLAETRPGAPYTFTAKPSGEEVVIKYRPSSDVALDNLEAHVRQSRAQIVEGITWAGPDGEPWEGKPKDDPLVQKFLQNDFVLVPEED